jgi:mRNA interferase MazF
MKAPSRGDVWIVDLGFAGKVRPCVVLSVPSLDQDRALVTVIPHTTSVRGSRFEVRIAKRFLDEGAFDAQNPVTLPHPRLIRRLGALSAQELVAIEDAVRLWLGLQ